MLLILLDAVKQRGLPLLSSGLPPTEQRLIEELEKEGIKQGSSGATRPLGLRGLERS